MRTTSDLNRQARTMGDAARRVGGYGELLRIERERRVIERRGGVAGIERGADGRYRCIEAVRKPTSEPVRPPSLLACMIGFLKP